MISFVKVSPGKGGRFIHLPTGLSQYGFEMLNYGSRLFDSVTGTNATCSINGIRYGIVNGVVTQFAVNQPPIEDKGLRGCPAFTQLAKMTETLTDVNWKGFASATTISTPFMGANTHFIKEINIDGTPKKHTKYQDTAYTERANKMKRVKAIHAKIANCRKDWAHKTTTEIAKAANIICVGNVSSKKLAKTKLAKSIHDAGWHQIRSLLKYKAIRLGADYRDTNEMFSTVTCSVCGSRSGPSGLSALGVRRWSCSSCGTEHDRDVNAARNILIVGLGHQTPIKGIPRL
jgi:IS605 OrfB family transposase